MKRIVIGLLLVMFCFFPSVAAAVSENDFEAKTTENLVNLCTVSTDDPLYPHAINFCHGYLVGAFHYHEVSTSGPEGRPLVCMPDPRPSRTEAINMFIDWIKAHPEYWGEPPVETEFRFLMEMWPCGR
jgi:hypothetical protein